MSQQQQEPLTRTSIECVQGEYDTFSFDAVNKLLYQLYMKYLRSPDYLFLSPSGYRSCRDEAMKYGRMFPSMIMQEQIVNDLPNIEQYVSPASGTSLWIVMLPTLPPHIFLLGTLKTTAS